MKINIIAAIYTTSTLLMTFFLISGCAGQHTKINSSVVDYLYPSGSEAIIKPSVPVLNLPLKVGIAFVPDMPASSGRYYGATHPARIGGGALNVATKTKLLESVASHFRELEFVSDIEVIPSAYLKAKGGFSNLEQIRTMYGIDVIALVSYDQVQFTDEGVLSMSYWTLIGAYVVSGEKNDTSTMLDTVVYDITSKKMLFRAPGISNIKGTSTLVNLSEGLRADSLKSFEAAADNMIENLDVQLNNFKEKIKRKPEQYKVIHQSSYSGGGTTGLLELAIVFSMVLARSAKKSNK